MRFPYVDRQKIRVIFVIVIDLNDVANLAPKRRSGKTAKDQNEWACPEAFANVKMTHAIERD